MGVVKFTTLKKKAYCDMLAQGMLKGAAAKQLHVDISTIRRAVQQDPDFEQAIEDALEAKHERVEDALYRKAMAGHVTAQIFYLSNRLPNKWQDVKAINVQGQLMHVTPEDVEKRLARYGDVLKELEEQKAITGEVVEEEES